MSTSINPITSGLTTDPTANQSGTTSSTNDPTQVANMDTFLQLLVAQMKNQDPESPTDSTQFVSQLAQFSELEQMIGVRSDVQVIRQDVTQAAAAAQTTTGTTTTTGV